MQGRNHIKMQTITPTRHGRALLANIFLIPAVLIGAMFVYFLFCETRKTYWDHQVKVLCKQDGGVKVYEKIVIPKSELEKLLNKYGQLETPDIRYATPASKFYLQSRGVRLRTSDPSVTKFEYDLYRATDKKLIASAISYGRGGGDFPTWAHDSSFSCTDFMGRDFLSFEKNIFEIEG